MANNTANDFGVAPGATKTGMPKSKAPKSLRNTGAGDQPYGSNRFGGASSDVPGENTVSGFEASKPGPVLAKVQVGGLKTTTSPILNDQLRDIGAKNVGDAHGMESNASRQASRASSSAVKIPATTGEAVSPDPSRNIYNDNPKG